MATLPGLEPLLKAEMAEIGFTELKAVAGGVEMAGGWPDVWRANLRLRGASRVLVRLGSFRAAHLSELDKKARRLPWGDVLALGMALKVEASCKRSKIYHTGAVAERVIRAAGGEAGEGADITLFVRIENNSCTVSIDTSGELLHKRGFKQAVSKAPLRETQAALFLRACGYQGTEPVLDPMCGSGTFPIEAAEWAAGLAPGRARGFSFEALKSFDPEAWAALKEEVTPRATTPRFYARDHDEGAIRRAEENAMRARVDHLISFRAQAIHQVEVPDGPPGLVMVNPPYGARIGDKGSLRSLYQTLGCLLKERAQGWRVGLVTSEAELARATGLPFQPPGPIVPHGALKIRLYQTKEL